MPAARFATAPSEPARLSGEIGASLGKNALEHIRRHRHEILTTAHPIGAFVLNGHANGTRGDLKSEDTPIRM